jgi:hypothetical protein
MEATSPCNPPRQELSKDTKNRIQSILDLITTKQNKLPSFIDRLFLENVEKGIDSWSP